MSEVEFIQQYYYLLGGGFHVFCFLHTKNLWGCMIQRIFLQTVGSTIQIGQKHSRMRQRSGSVLRSQPLTDDLELCVLHVFRVVDLMMRWPPGNPNIAMENIPFVDVYTHTPETCMSKRMFWKKISPLRC